jgi:hypothetical protein
MSKELLAVKIVQLSLILIDLCYQMRQKSRKKFENALLEKYFNIFLKLFFLSLCHKVTPIKILQ